MFTYENTLKRMFYVYYYVYFMYIFMYVLVIKMNPSGNLSFITEPIDVVISLILAVFMLESCKTLKAS